MQVLGSSKIPENLSKKKDARKEYSANTKRNDFKQTKRAFTPASDEPKAETKDTNEDE